MITCYLMGGLGNQLFQIFATISSAMIQHNKFVFLNSEALSQGNVTIRYTYWKNLLSNLKPFLINSFDYDIVEKEKSFKYNELNKYEPTTNIILHGYFQSYKYFQDNFKTIYRLLGFEKKKEILINKLQITNEYLSNSISMHFRLGDYKNLQQYHPIMDYEYYEKSLTYIKSKITTHNINVIYFCEEEDIDVISKTVNRLKEKFEDFTFVLVDKNLEDWEQMLLMSCCHHNIVANSSFSWWAAYLNSWSDKIICYPSVWFGPKAGHDTKDLCPPEWNKIDL
jgi:hypothetical protein